MSQRGNLLDFGGPSSVRGGMPSQRRTVPLPRRGGASSSARTRVGGGAKVGGGAAKAVNVHTVQKVNIPSLTETDIAGLATNITNLRKIRGNEESFNTVLKMLDGVHSGDGREFKSQLNSYPRVYMNPAVAQALEQVAINGGLEHGTQGRFIGKDYGDVKITLGQDGSLLVPGSRAQKRALQVHDLVGTVTMDNPIPNDNGRISHGVTLGSPTYWKIYAQLPANKKVAWHNRLFDLGLADAAYAAGLQPNVTVSGYADLPKESKEALRKGYDAAKNPEKVRLGYLAAVATLLQNVHILETDKSEAVEPSKWATSRGKAHADAMTKEILKGVFTTFMKEMHEDAETGEEKKGSEIFAETGALWYVPTDKNDPLRYSSFARGESNGRKKSTQRSLWNPMNVAIDEATGRQVLITKGDRSGAMSKAGEKSKSGRGKPATLHAAAFSGPYITARGEFRNVMARPQLAGGGRSAHMRPGKQYTLKGQIEASDPQVVRQRTNVVRKDNRTYSVPSKRGQSSARIPKSVQEQLAARGFAPDSGGYYAMAAGYDRRTGQYAPISSYGDKTWNDFAMEKQARDMELGNYTDPSTADWKAFAEGRGPHPYAKAPARERKQPYF